MVRQTSINVYRKIEAEGLLSRLRWQVYSYLYEHGPMTCRELMMGIQRDRGRSFVVAGGSMSTRFSELERRGVIKAIGLRKCRETGREVTEWDVTDALPIKFEKPKRHKCKACNGLGYIQETQTKLF